MFVEYFDMIAVYAVSDSFGLADYDVVIVVFFNDTATAEIYTRSLVGSVRCV